MLASSFVVHEHEAWLYDRAFESLNSLVMSRASSCDMLTARHRRMEGQTAWNSRRRLGPPAGRYAESGCGVNDSGRVLWKCRPLLWGRVLRPQSGRRRLAKTYDHRR